MRFVGERARARVVIHPWAHRQAGETQFFGNSLKCKLIGYTEDRADTKDLTPLLRGLID